MYQFIISSIFGKYIIPYMLLIGKHKYNVNIYG